MFFRGPGQNGHNQYFPQGRLPHENTQRITFNNSFTASNRPDLQQKIYKNLEPQNFNPSHQNMFIKPDQNINYEQSRQRPVSFYGVPNHAQTSQILTSTVYENSHQTIQQQMIFIRNERGQMMEKMKKIEEELFHRDQIIKVKQNEILDLKHANSISKLTKTSSFGRLSETKPEKQQLDYQTKQLNDQILSLKAKLEKTQNQNARLAHKNEELLNKNSYDQNRKGKREQILQSELSLFEKRHQRLKAQYERQMLILKQKVKELQEGKNRSNVQNSTVSSSQNNYSEHLKTSNSNSSKSLNSSTFEIEKLQNQLVQKNELIKYLQLQSLRESQAKSQFQDYHKISQLYDQLRQENAKIQKQVQKLKSEADFLATEKRKRENDCKQLRVKNEALEYVVSEMRLWRENREKNEQQQSKAYELKIKELSGLLLSKSTIISKQALEIQSAIKKYEFLVNDSKIKSAEQTQKNRTIQEQEQEKKKLMSKIAEYQQELNSKTLRISLLEEQIGKAKFNEEFMKSQQNKIMDQNIEGMQKELKAQIGKTAQLMVTKTSLERQCRQVKTNFEREIQKLIEKLDFSDKRTADLELALNSTRLELEKVRISEGQKLCQIAQLQEKKSEREKAYELEKQKLMGEIVHLKGTVLKQSRNEQSLKSVILVLQEKSRQQNEQIEKDGSKIQNENVGLVGKIKELNSLIENLKDSMMAKQKQMSIVQQRMETAERLSHTAVEFQQELKKKDEQIQRLLVCQQKLNQVIFESSQKQKERDVAESKREEQRREEAMRSNAKELRIEQLTSQVQVLQCTLGSKQVTIKKLSLDLQQKVRESQILIQHQNELLSLQAESIAQTEQIKVLRKMIGNKQAAQSQYRNTLELKLNSLQELEQQLKTVTQQLQTVNSQFSQYKLQEQLRVDLKQEHAATVVLSSRSKGRSIKNIVSGDSLSDRGKDGDSFVADFIEIDRNALLYICDLLNIVPCEDEVLKRIIEFLEQSSCLKCEKFYVEILELFGVEEGVCEQAHLNLICEIKQYRMTISTFIQKMDMLEKRVDSANKENRNLLKELDFKAKEIDVLGDLVLGLNGDLVLNKMKWMSERYGRIDGLEVKDTINF